MIALADVVVELRKELDRARAAAAGEQLQFALGPIELEVTVAIEREAGAGGKVRFWGVELGGDAKATHSSTQRIMLTLQPQIAGSPASVMVTGDQTERER